MSQIMQNERLCKCNTPSSCYDGVHGIACRIKVLQALRDWFKIGSAEDKENSS